MGDVAPLIQFQNVTKTFRVGKKTVTAVDDVSLDIGSGDVFAMIGYSGAGKSTLVRLINGLERPTSGRDASRVTVALVDAAQTPLSLKSIDGAVINNTYLAQSNIDPKSALYADDPTSPGAEPYINVIVARAEEKDNPTYQKLVDVFHSPAVTEAYAKESKGTQLAVTKNGQDCAAILSRIEQQIRNEK
ncbi:Putative ABC-type transporter%2C periplasmic component [Mycobacteroides abscessus]|nr:Putative ABC-type transporter%2C periplasmic component [Mycobacteroides abscessus]